VQTGIVAKGGRYLQAAFAGLFRGHRRMTAGTRSTRALPSRGLYAITNGPRPDLLAAVEAALGGGAALLQYRDKTTDRARRETEAVALAALAERYGVPLIVNDDIDLAAVVGAAGVHLGESDPAFGEARARLGPDAVIGVSCYDSIDRARAAVAAGATYVAFGAFHATATKPAARRADRSILHDARGLGVPRVAIGGITPDNARPLIDAGADFVAVIAGLFDSADIGATARRYVAAFSGHPQDRA
jgi:thiamine-phosphate pyrophosphorylase